MPWAAFDSSLYTREPFIVARLFACHEVHSFFANNCLKKAKIFPFHIDNEQKKRYNIN